VGRAWHIAISASGRPGYRLGKQDSRLQPSGRGLDTVEANQRLGFKADQRDYGIGVQILRQLGVSSVRLLSNNPQKLAAIEKYGLSVSEFLSIEVPVSASSLRYLTTKRDKLGHILREL
jgi:3,4-dihydroxy 2-butanone 4-phosphate synthase / GTP cyclohydrolase II